MTCQKLSLILCISCFLAFSQNNPNFANLPKPVLDDHPNWLVLYDSAWVIAKKNIKERFPNTNYVQWHIDEAMSYWKIWQWDFCFITMFSKYSNREFPMIEQLENFYMSQRANGFICRELYVENMKDVLPDPTSSSEAINKDPPNPNPPLYSMAEWDYYLVTGDMSHFTKQITSCRPDEPAQTKTVFQRIVDNYWWIKNNIRHSDGFYTSDYYANGMASQGFPPRHPC